MNNNYSHKLKHITDRVEKLSGLTGVTQFIRIGPMTVCKIESDDSIAMGLSICGEDDLFAKSAGRFWASKRAIRAHMGRSLAKATVSPQGLAVLLHSGMRFKQLVSAWVFRGDGKDEFYKFIGKLTEQYKKSREITLHSDASVTV